MRNIATTLGRNKNLFSSFLSSNTVTFRILDNVICDWCEDLLLRLFSWLNITLPCKLEVHTTWKYIILLLLDSKQTIALCTQ